MNKMGLVSAPRECAFLGWTMNKYTSVSETGKLREAQPGQYGDEGVLEVLLIKRSGKM